MVIRVQRKGPRIVPIRVRYNVTLAHVLLVPPRVKYRVIVENRHLIFVALIMPLQREIVCHAVKNVAGCSTVGIIRASGLVTKALASLVTRYMRNTVIAQSLLELYPVLRIQPTRRMASTRATAFAGRPCRVGIIHARNYAIPRAHIAMTSALWTQRTCSIAHAAKQTSTFSFDNPERPARTQCPPAAPPAGNVSRVAIDAKQNAIPDPVHPARQS